MGGTHDFTAFLGHKIRITTSLHYIHVYFDKGEGDITKIEVFTTGIKTEIKKCNEFNDHNKAIEFISFISCIS